MRLSNILQGPVVTEKSLAGAQFGRYTFWVNPAAAKGEIARAVSHLFGVQVLAVKTISLSGRKKAVVQLAKDQKIDLFESKEK